MRPPNILWICSDQQRWDTLGCYGNPYVRTPHLDRLAQTGIVFDHCYSQSPVCTPSRASFLTGRYPRTNRCRQNGQSIPNDEVLVTKLLSNNAYRGGLAGRLLANADYTEGLAGKLHISACHPSVAPAMERRIDDGYAEFHWSHHPDADWPTNEYLHWLRERGASYTRSSFRGSRYVEVSVPAEHHQTTWCAQQAINFMEAASSFDRPWLFSVNFYDPHHPFDPPPEYLERYLDHLHDLPLPAYQAGELDHKPVFQRLDHQGAYNTPGRYAAADMNDDDHRLIRAAYYAMIDLLDVQIGRMLAVLDETGQRDNTLVVFMSDHGELLGDHGMYLKGPHFYDGGVRVPLIMSLPGVIQSGQQSAALVELVDLAPTLLDAVGAPPYQGMQGRSLWPLLTEAEDKHQHRDDVYCEYHHAMPVHSDPRAYATMVRTHAHKVVVYHGLDIGELYDLNQDPYETVNEWNNPDYASVRNVMISRVMDRLAWTVDPLPVRQAGW